MDDSQYLKVPGTSTDGTGHVLYSTMHGMSPGEVRDLQKIHFLFDQVCIMQSVTYSRDALHDVIQVYIKHTKNWHFDKYTIKPLK